MNFFSPRNEKTRRLFLHNAIAMTLRTITNWTTLLVLSLTIVVPVFIILVVINLNANEMGVATLTFYAPFYWLFTGLPLIVSYYITKKQKYNISVVILFVATSVYGFLYVLMWYSMLYLDGRYSFLFFIIGFPIMIPAWITVMVMNAYYVKQTKSQTESKPLR